MAGKNVDIDVRRAYDDDVRDGSALRGTVFLVDGMWPRGIKKEELPIDQWLKELAPSSELRKWFGHRADRWDGFRESYAAELDDKPEALAPLLDAARRRPVTLLFATKETEHNNAVALREYVRDVVRQKG